MKALPRVHFREKLTLRAQVLPRPKKGMPLIKVLLRQKRPGVREPTRRGGVQQRLDFRQEDSLGVPHHRRPPEWDALRLPKRIDGVIRDGVAQQENRLARLQPAGTKMSHLQPVERAWVMPLPI